MRFVLSICALCAVAACGGSDKPPAQDPSATAAPALPSAPANGNTSDSTTTPRDSRPTPQGPSAPPAPVGAADNGPPPSNADAAVADNAGAHDHTKDADNTKINERDRHKTLTPMNQGESGDEIKITATIRKGLMGDKSLSFTAKNVKIITVGTKVTLRGPVNSDQEKASIEARSKQTPGVTDVDDQLEVKK